MLYISLQPREGSKDAPTDKESSSERQQDLTYSCKHCGFVEKAPLGVGPVLSTDYADDQTSYMQHVSPFLRHDPTLPRVNDIACPNTGCGRPEGVANEVIEVKYDAVNLKYLYHCVHCLAFWKGGSGGGSVALQTVAGIGGGR